MAAPRLAFMVALFCPALRVNLYIYFLGIRFAPPRIESRF
jgi:hypothetical protein